MELAVTLLSDGCFGSGEGVPGVVDEEIEYDALTGLPEIGGRRLKGLLVEECANILYSVGRHSQSLMDRFDDAAEFLFGSPGSTSTGQGHLHVDSARLPADLRATVRQAVLDGDVTVEEVLRTFTDIRQQTAVDPTTGVPLKNSLRNLRVFLRKTKLRAAIDLPTSASPDALGLLAACVKGVHRGGKSRNRGRGRLHVLFQDEAVTNRHFQQFSDAILNTAKS